MRQYATKANRAVFTEFYDTDDTARAYAKAKLESGTAALTPESVGYMQGVIDRRRKAKVAADAVAAQEAKDKAANELAR